MNWAADKIWLTVFWHGGGDGGGGTGEGGEEVSYFGLWKPLQKFYA